MRLVVKKGFGFKRTILLLLSWIKEMVNNIMHLKINKVCYKVKPDIVSTWKDAPFPDEYFDMIVFVPTTYC